MSTTAPTEFANSPNPQQTSATLAVAMIVVAVAGLCLLLGTELEGIDHQTQRNHAFQFVMIVVLGGLVLVAIFSQWIFNRADDDVWDREIAIASDFADYRAALQRCCRRLVCESIDKPISNDPWSPESLRKWERIKWLSTCGVIASIALFIAVCYLLVELDYSGPLVGGVAQLFLTVPILLLLNWRSTQKPPRIEEELFGNEPVSNSPWYKYHDAVLQDLGLWFLVSGHAYGEESRGVYLNDHGNLTVELGDQHCRITTLLSDDTVVQTQVNGESEISQGVNANWSTRATTEPATRLLEALNLHQDAIDTAIKYSEAIPVRLTADNYAHALAFARWRNA